MLSNSYKVVKQFKRGSSYKFYWRYAKLKNWSLKGKKKMMEMLKTVKTDICFLSVWMLVFIMT